MYYEDEPKYRACSECGYFEGHYMNCPYSPDPEEEEEEEDEKDLPESEN